MMGEDYAGVQAKEQEPIRINANELFTKVFFRMFLGLFATAAIAGFTFYSGMILNIVESGAYVGIIIAEFVVVLAFSLGFRKFSASTVSFLYFAYACLTGVTFSCIFAVFELESIMLAFASTAAVFGVLAYIGKNTQRDLTNFGTILYAALIVGVIVSVINLFIGNSFLDIVLDWTMLAIFMGLTVYDMNKITAMADSEITEKDKLYVYGAMQLYLDFINIFIRLLSLFGKRRN